MKFNHVAISVNNLKESTEFYRKYFEFEFEAEFEKKKDSLRFAFLKKDNFRLEIFEFSKPLSNKDDLSDLKITGLRHLAFEVADLHRDVDKLSSLGLIFGQIMEGTSCKYYTFTKDPNGIPIELYEPNK